MNYKNSVKLAIFSAALAFILLPACQNAQEIEYKKYESASDVPRMSVEEAKKEFDAGKIVFVDSRNEAAFKHERLPGAILIPVGSTEDKFSVLPKGKKIVVYCT